MADNKGRRILVASFAIILMIVFLITWRLLEVKRGNKRYAELEIGMSKHNVSEIWGLPEYVFKVETGKEIWSYEDKGHPIHLVTMSFRREVPRSTEPVALDKLNDMSGYSNTEMLFDTNGELEAYTIIGETDVIYSRYGDIPGPRWDVYAEFIRNLPQQEGERSN